MPTCPLCFATANQLWLTNTSATSLAGREYWNCQVCDLVFVPAKFHLRPAQELEVYLQHENNPDDPGYRQFLSRLYQPLLQQLALLPVAKAKITGLDFGSGPGPTLSLMFNEAGYTCANYDPYFDPHPHLLNQNYTFITSSEVFEHLAQPAQVIQQLVNCLRPQGFLGIMTQRPLNQEAFKTWHYLADPTHITFYTSKCFAWIAAHWQLERVYLSKDVILLRKF